MEAASTTSSVASSVDGRSVGGTTGSEYLNLGMFSSQQQQGDLLVGAGASGFGGVGSALNGFGSQPGLASSSETTPGTSFDLSDFPSLGGTNNPAVAGSGNGLAAALRQKQQLLAHQQMFGTQQAGTAQSGSASTNLYRLAMTGTNGNFTMASEDFPALSGAPQNAPGSSALTGTPSSLLGSSNAVSRAPSNGGGLYGVSDLDNQAGSQLDGTGAGGLLGGAGLGGLGGLRGLQQLQSNNPSSNISRAQQASAPSGAGAVGSSGTGAASSGSTVGNALSGDYGLLGLLGVIRMTDADRNALALGSDLTMLGLNLGSTEQIYSTFSSPWSDVSVSKEPHYQVRMQARLHNIGWVQRSHFLTPSSFNTSASASDVLLHAAPSPEDRSLVEIPAGNAVLHFLRATAGCPAGLRSAGAVL